MSLIINVTYDASVASAPAGFKVAFAAAVAFYEHAFTNNITINVNLGYGEVGGTTMGAGVLGQSSTAGNYYSYAQIKNALSTHVTSADDAAAVATLLASDPTSGGLFFTSIAEQAALGLSTTGTFDGSIGIASLYPFSYDPNNRAGAGTYDAVGVMEHELGEVMGRIGSLGSAFGANVYTPLDLFRYSSSGVRDLTPGPGSFSINGVTLLQQYNNPMNGGDTADWIPTLQGDSYGDGHQDNVGQVTPTDVREMDILGYTRGPATRDDFTGDAVSDILFRNNTTGDTGYWGMNGGQATWVDIGGSSTAYNVVGVGDFNGDFTADILWRNNTTGDTGFYAMPLGGGAAVWNDIGSSAAAYSVVGVGDFNGDGTADILFRNAANGDTGYWTMGGGKVTAWHDIGATSTAYQVVGVGDFNGSGRADILWENPTNRDTGVFLLSAGQATWQDLGTLAFGYTVAGVGDFNGDGISDILFRNAATGDFGDWAMNSLAQPTWHDLGLSSTAYNVVAVGDYTGDGTSDILWRNNSTGDTGYHAMSGGQVAAWHDIGTSSTAYTIPTAT